MKMYILIHKRKMHYNNSNDIMLFLLMLCSSVHKKIPVKSVLIKYSTFSLSNLITDLKYVRCQVCRDRKQNFIK